MHWFTTHMTSRTCARPCHSREPVAQSNSHMWVVETQPFDHHLLPPRICFSWKLQLGVETGLKPEHKDVGCNHTKHLLKPCLCPFTSTDVHTHTYSYIWFLDNFLHFFSFIHYSCDDIVITQANFLPSRKKKLKKCRANKIHHYGL